MPDITIPVPEDRVADFYQFFGQWLAGDLQGTTGHHLDSSGTPGAGVDTRVSWTLDDDAAAEQLWRKMSGRARGLFTFLMEEPGKRYTGAQIAEAVGIPNGANGVAGVLAWPGRFCYQLQRPLPTQWEDGEDGAPSVYWIEPGIAKLFERARDEVGAN